MMRHRIAALNGFKELRVSNREIIELRMEEIIFNAVSALAKKLNEIGLLKWFCCDFLTVFRAKTTAISKTYSQASLPRANR